MTPVGLIKVKLCKLSLPSTKTMTVKLANMNFSQHSNKFWEEVNNKVPNKEDMEISSKVMGNKAIRDMEINNKDMEILSSKGMDNKETKVMEIRVMDSRAIKDMETNNKDMANKVVRVVLVDKEDKVAKVDGEIKDSKDNKAGVIKDSRDNKVNKDGVIKVNKVNKANKANRVGAIRANNKVDGVTKVTRIQVGDDKHI